MNPLRLLSSLRQLLFPATCPICGRRLKEQDSYLCLDCALTAPITNLWRSRGNPIEHQCWGQMAIERAAAFLWFSDNSPWQQLIHNFKYHNHWYYAENMGRWFATELSTSDFLDGIELIVPVPLHWRRTLWRGYNQSEHIAAGMSHISSIPYDFSVVRRIVHTPPQARMRYADRWSNISDIFAVTHPERLVGRHILLVDDVFTSGATLMALARAIYEACDGNVKISIATLAASHHLIAQ